MSKFQIFRDVKCYQHQISAMPDSFFNSLNDAKKALSKYAKTGQLLIIEYQMLENGTYSKQGKIVHFE